MATVLRSAIPAGGSMRPIGRSRMTVEVRYLGHLGNNLFQYALGRCVAETLGAELRCVPAHALPGWSAVEREAGIVDRLSNCVTAFADAPQHLPGARGTGAPLRYVLGERPGWSGHGLDLAHLLRAGAGRTVVLHGYFQRSEYYQPHRERIRGWYRWAVAPPGPALGPDDVLVHLRQSADMFVLDRALDLGFYRDALREMRPARTWVCGLGLGPAVHAALAPFAPTYLDLPAIPTLALMTRAPRIVLANSTFSWWGAWLSDAREVVFPCPVRGVWSAERPDVALEVPEARYRYVRDVPVQTWRPFAPAADVRLSLARSESDEPMLVARGVERGVRGPLPSPALLPLAEWLCRRREPFGLVDLFAEELVPPPHAQAAALLIAACRVGALRAPDAALGALAGFYGLAR